MRTGEGRPLVTVGAPDASLELTPELFVLNDLIHRSTDFANLDQPWHVEGTPKGKHQDADDELRRKMSHSVPPIRDTQIGINVVPLERQPHEMGFDVSNALLLPIIGRGRRVGLLVGGSRTGFHNSLVILVRPTLHVWIKLRRLAIERQCTECVSLVFKSLCCKVQFERMN
jgi:hypothetical protein